MAAALRVDLEAGEVWRGELLVTVYGLDGTFRALVTAVGELGEGRGRQEEAEASSASAALRRAVARMFPGVDI